MSNNMNEKKVQWYSRRGHRYHLEAEELTRGYQGYSANTIRNDTHLRTRLAEVRRLRSLSLYNLAVAGQYSKYKTAPTEALKKKLKERAKKMAMDEYGEVFRPWGKPE